MTLDTHSVKFNAQNKKYVEQTIDELDKNHSADDPNQTNEAKMYINPGKKILNQFQITVTK